MTIDFVNFELIMLTLKINLSNDILFNIQLLQAKLTIFLFKKISCYLATFVVLT